MLLRWILAALHLLALGIGLGSIIERARGLGAVQRDPGAVSRVLFADSLWGVAALVWIVTGAWRAFGGVEKGSAYYLAEPSFHAKMGLLLVILLLELWPMITLVRWRIALGKRQALDLSRAPLFARISWIQALLTVGMVFAATAMARGIRW